MAIIPAHGNSDCLHEDESAAVATEDADVVAVMVATADPLPIGSGEWQNALSATVS